MALSLFDVFGPVMHGPSSNHTAGAVRIGYLARQIMGQEPSRIELRFHPCFMQAYAGQRSHTALLAGCLGLREYDPLSADSIRLCRERGIPWSISALEDTNVSRNTMQVEAEAGGLFFSVRGDSIGGGSVVINAVNGADVTLDGSGYICLILSRDQTALEKVSKFLCRWMGEKEYQCRLVPAGDGSSLCCMTASTGFPTPDMLPSEIRSLLCCDMVYRTISPLSAFTETDRHPLFSSFSELISQAARVGLEQAVFQYECKRSGVSERRILEESLYRLSVVKETLLQAERGGIHLLGGLTDPEDGAKLLLHAESGNSVAGPWITKAMARAVLLAQMNASSCRIVAAPTAGASGAMPAALLTAGERYRRSDVELATAFLISAAVGVVIGNWTSFSGTVGGCQSEIGVGSAMAAAGVVWLAGGTAEQVVHGAAITLKNMLGLTCDAPASPVEVPCIKRNAMGAAMAFCGAEMAMAGIRSAIAPDDVAAALRDTQLRMPAELKASYVGGLAGTPSGKALRERWEMRLRDLKEQDCQAPACQTRPMPDQK